MQWFLGQMVRSKQGRDQGRYYVIMKTEAKYCFLADGRKTTVGNLKKKNFKHLQGTKCCSREIGEKLAQGGMATDGEIRAFLNDYQPEKVTKEE